MRAVREIKVGERAVIVRELTVGEIRAWLLKKTEALGDLVDVSLFDDFSLPDLTQLTDLTSADIDTLTPSQIDEAMVAARELNTHFFEMRARMVAMGRALAEMPPSESPTLSAASPA